MAHRSLARWILLGVVALVASSGIKAQDVSGAGFYPFRGSARTIGLAGAFTALSDDTAGLNFNPAGMVQIVQRQASFDLKVNGNGESYYRLAYVEPITQDKPVGGGFMYSRSSDGTGRVDKVYQFTYAQPVYEGLAAGVNLRYHAVDTVGASDEAFSFDLGLLYTPPSAPQWTAGLVVLDIPEPSFQGVGLAKRVYNAGVAYHPDDRTTLALDWYDIGSIAKRGHLRFGGERLLTDNIAVRAGVGEDTFGVGVSVMWRYFTLDYGFQRVDNGPDLNLLTVLANF